MILSTIVYCHSLFVVRVAKMSPIIVRHRIGQMLPLAIKTQRCSLGILQEELAYRAGLHRTYVSDLER
jgi:hypothetical protein